MYVVLIARTAHNLAGHLSWSAVGEFALVFSLIWIAWLNSTAYHDSHGRDDIRSRTYIFVAAAITGDIASRYITVLQDSVQIASMDATQQCERRFILPGGGAYEATLAVADDRGVTATCSRADVGVDALYPGYWPIADFAMGIYNSERTDIADAS